MSTLVVDCVNLNIPTIFIVNVDMVIICVDVIETVKM